MSEQFINFNSGHAHYLQENIPGLLGSQESGPITTQVDVVITFFRQLEGNPHRAELLDHFYHALIQEINQVNILTDIESFEFFVSLGKSEKVQQLLPEKLQAYEKMKQQITSYQELLQALPNNSEYTAMLTKRVADFVESIPVVEEKLIQLQKQLQ